MKWFFVLNSAADLWFRDMVKAAVHSAAQHTDLEPHCIYDGGDTPLSRWIEGRGVTMHRARLPCHGRLSAPEVLAANAGSAYSPVNAEGAFLKLLIPDFCAPEERFLFTDCDVIFRPGFPCAALRGLRDGFFAVHEMQTPPSPSSPAENFNSGVFVTTASAMNERRPRMWQVLEENRYFFWGKPGFYDQGLLNIIYRGDWTPVTPWINWRVFWPSNPGALLLHFHGPKPQQIRRILAGQPDRVDSPGIIGMVNRDREHYAACLDIFDKVLAEATRDDAV